MGDEVASLASYPQRRVFLQPTLFGRPSRELRRGLGLQLLLRFGCKSMGF